MGTMIPRAIIGRAGYQFESETVSDVAEWERKRKCLTENPDNFDYDATKDMHLKAKEACDVCPVQEQCLRQRMLGNTEHPMVAGGVYAGLMWDVHPGVAPMEIEEWHKRHKVGNPFRGTERPVYEEGWSEERICLNPHCNETFVVTRSNHTKEYHNTACRRRWRNEARRVSA